MEAHGFLHYLVRCAKNDSSYTIFGYRGKQVRDQIHSEDVVRAIHEIVLDPGTGDVFNLGGGPDNSASILECIQILEDKLGKKIRTILSERARVGDHICYYSDTSKFRCRYPSWRITRPLDSIINEMLESVR